MEEIEEERRKLNTLLEKTDDYTTEPLLKKSREIDDLIVDYHIERP